ncbi:cilia- and flagella-associated protein 46 [Protopterus annectens]|uniref:cilia- and flagella-associated protein 46 n=1 Tax=Protopterus annectens TaxID=7888 RepID=UPI001CFC2727|nr:cilia- and flagella-associated protein 46 [Protopterus annectens]
MDFRIRQYLTSAENYKDIFDLKNAYQLIKATNQERPAVDGAEAFNSDLYVLCAEQGIQLGQPDISKDCLMMYFKGKPPPNQFLGRAYLCQGQLQAPGSSEHLDKFEKSAAYFLKAMLFAKEQPRYHFLVYNATVLYWKMVRPFLKPGSRYVLIPSLTRVVKALDETEEPDYEWRGQLMMELIECFLDAGKTKEASNAASTAADFIKANVPQRYHQIFSLQVRYKFIDPARVAKEIKSSMVLSIIQKIQKLKSSLDAKEPLKDIPQILNEIHQNFAQYDLEYFSPAEQLEKIPLLLELAWLSLDLGCHETAFACLSDAKKVEVTIPGNLIEIECLECYCEIQKLGFKAEIYTKDVVEKRLKLIERVDVALQNAVRYGEPNVIQVACVTQWNLCLPLLQHNLRKSVRKTLRHVADVLEQINSLMIQFRCQVHVEIAQIEDDEDQIESAIEHAKKALHLDEKLCSHEFLEVLLHRLQLRATLYETPKSSEDHAAMIIEQCRKGTENDHVRRKRPLLVQAGQLLAPDAFQTVLDSESETKVTSGAANIGLISQLCAKAQHHTTCVQKAAGHLKRLGDTMDRERMRLWADLAKVARKQEVWDVCRAACRFCLLYDDGRWTASKGVANGSQGGGTQLRTSPVLNSSSAYERDLLRILAEVCFINGEASIHLLRSEGCQLNEPAVPPKDTSKHPIGHLAKNPDEDPEWKIYRDWIAHLSQCASENFLRAARLGVDLNEAWIVCNAAVYILNYNKHIITSGRQREIMKTLQTLYDAFIQVGHNGETVLLAMLSNALAQGLINPWIKYSSKKSEEKKETEKNSPVGKRKKSAQKGSEKTSNVQTAFVEPDGLPDVKKALEVCEHILSLTNGAIPSEVVCIAVRQQVLSTWVKVKQMLQHQIGSKLGTEDENNNEGQNLMTKILVALEMYSCNGCGLMEFTVPALHVVAKMALECKWTDTLLELQTWTCLAHFAYAARDHEMVMTCSQKALQLDKIIDKDAAWKKQNVQDYNITQEMLSKAACFQGQSILDHLAWKSQLRKEAFKCFEMSARYAEKAENFSFVMVAAKLFWNACLPLIPSPGERAYMKDSLKTILNAISVTCPEYKQPEEKKTAYVQHIIPEKTGNSTHGVFKSSEDTTNDLMLIAAMYGLLFHIYADQKDWERGLKVLDDAVQTLPRTRHRLLIFKHRVIVKARLGRSFMMDIQKFKDEDEEYVSYMWHRVAACCREKAEQLDCYLNAIETLQHSKMDWQKVDYLIEFAEWLYCRQFPVIDALSMLDWAVDILLLMGIAEKSNPKEEAEHRNESLIPVKTDAQIGVKSMDPNMSFADIRSVRQLEALARAHTLMAVISGQASSHHQEHCLMAYTYILQIWKLSLSAVGPLLKALTKTQPSPSQQTPRATPRKDNTKKERKEAAPPTVTEKSKRKGVPDALPSGIEEWANYDCPEEARDVFKMNSPLTVSKNNIIKPMHCLYYIDLLVEEMKVAALVHLTLPVLQLAEVISQVVVDSKSLSDLYHLRISKVCSELGLCQAAQYHRKAAGTKYIHEEEQIRCRQDILQKQHLQRLKDDAKHLAKQPSAPGVSTATKNITKGVEVNLEASKNSISGKKLSGLSIPDMWIDKAELCLQLGLYEPSRQLLSEAHAAAAELADKDAVARCLYLLAVMANQEKNHKQAEALLNEAQNIGGDEHFWFNTVCALVQALLGDNASVNVTVACELLQHTVKVFRSALEEKPNRSSVLGFMIASMEFRMVSIQIKAELDPNANKDNSPEIAKSLLDACDKMSHIETEFLQYGYMEKSAEVMMEHANLLRVLAKHTTNEDLKHRHFLDAYALAQQAVIIQEEVFRDIYSLLSYPETRNISLPAAQNLTDLKVKLAEIALDMLQQRNAEERKKALDDEKKEPLLRAVEEFVRETPDLMSVIQEWITTCKSVGHAALVQLECAHSLSGSSTERRAECLYLMGKCLHLAAAQMDPLSPCVQWDPSSQEEANILLMKQENNEETEEKPEMFDLKVTQQQHKKSATLTSGRNSAQQYMSQATDILLQSIYVSFNNNYIDLLAAAAIEMVELLGQFDSLSAAQYLALYQSCTAAMMMKDVLLAATSDTSNSELAALLHLHCQRREAKDRGENGFLKMVEERISAISMAWNNLIVQSQHLNYLNDIPPDLSLLILQHSQDRSLLYGAFINKPNDSQKAKVSHQGGLPVKAKVARVAVNSDTLSGLLEKNATFKQEAMQALLKREYRHSQVAQQAVFQKDDKTFPSLESEAPKVHTITDGDRKLTSDFQIIVDTMEDYLQPILSQFDFSIFRQQTQPGSATDSAKIKSKDKEEKPASAKAVLGPPPDTGKSIILLADKSLMELPLEALRDLQHENIGSLSRCFSLQHLHSCLHREETVEGDTKKTSKEGKEAKSKEEKKKTKGVSINRELPPNCIPVDTNSFRYIVDPYHEARDSEEFSPAKKMSEILEKYGHQFASQWEGDMGSQLVPSYDRWEYLMSSCSAFIFYGTGQFLSYLLPSRMAAMDLTDCQVAILLDLVQTRQSFARLSKLDLEKSDLWLSLERPIETAVLLSLAGVRSVILNQWPSTLQQNAVKLEFLCENLLQIGKTTGQTICALCRNKPHDFRQSDREDPGNCSPRNREDPKGNEKSFQPKICPSLFNCVMYGLPNLVVT